MFDLSVFCYNFYASRFLPISCWKDEKLIFSAGLPEGIIIPEGIVEKLKNAKIKPAAYTASDNGLYGIIEAADYNAYIILGPAYSVPVSEDVLRSFMLSAHVSAARKDELRPYLAGNPHYSYNRFINLLAFLHYILNEEELDLTERFFASKQADKREIASKQVVSSISAREDGIEHGTWLFEQRMLDYVKRGKTDELKNFLLYSARHEKLNEGKLADDAMRQAKNIFIGTVTMVGKSGAIPGGMDVEFCYQLIDTYIRECERLNSVEAIKSLQFNMLMDFTTRVSQAQLPQNMSNEIYSCIQFISTHICENIGIDDIAKHIGKSRSYVTRKVREELGCSVTDYITRCKMNEAKSMLEFTDMTLSQISEYLNYGNQSYFQNVFKKYFGITPAKYRMEHMQ